MGVFGAGAPSTLRAFATQGQLSPEQMLQRFGIEYEPVRDLLIEYLRERAPSLDHTTLRGLAATLGRLFWRDLEIHHPGISSLNLPPTSRRPGSSGSCSRHPATGPGGQVIETHDLRSNGRAELGQVRAFYLDIAQWAMEDPARWGQWAAPCPVAPRRPGPDEGDPPAQVPDGPAHPRTPAGPAGPGRQRSAAQARVSAGRLAAAQARRARPGVHRQRRRRCAGPRPVSGPTARIWAEDPAPGTAGT